MGIRGNEKADHAAKAASDLEEAYFKIPYTDFKCNISKLIQTNWQSSWDNAQFNKLHSVQSALGFWCPASRALRREEVVINRCRIGHTRITNSYLLKREQQPFCIPCQEPYTIKHILIDCIDLASIGANYFHVNFLL